MSGLVVLDASTALAWCFPDEASEDAEAVLLALEGATVLVPAVWSLEIANALLVGERQKRLRQPEILRFLTRDCQNWGNDIYQVGACVNLRV